MKVYSNIACMLGSADWACSPPAEDPHCIGNIYTFFIRLSIVCALYCHSSYCGVMVILYKENELLCLL